MTFSLRRHADLSVTPWKNGGGRTRELLVLRDTTGEPAVRVSMAEVGADGPFSAYPGVARTLAILRGDPLALRVDGQDVLLAPGEAVQFDGGATTTCRLTGAPVEDLGVMVWDAPGRPARHAVIEFASADAATPGPDVLAVVVAGLGVAGPEGELGVGDALVQDRSAGQGQVGEQDQAGEDTTGQGQTPGSRDTGWVSGPGQVALVRWSAE